MPIRYEDIEIPKAAKPPRKTEMCVGQRGRAERFPQPDGRIVLHCGNDPLRFDSLVMIAGDIDNPGLRETETEEARRGVEPEQAHDPIEPSGDQSRGEYEAGI